MAPVQHVGMTMWSNLKQPHEKRVRPKSPAQKRPGKDPKHLANIRELPCCVCGAAPPSECHHVKQGTGERGMGLRSSDKWALPLCNEHHINGVERAGSRNEIAWFQARGIEPLTLARALWASKSCLEAMRNIIETHRGETGEQIWP